MPDPYIHITQHKKGLKMSGFISINTSPGENPFCKKQCRNERSVCKHCYARSMEFSYSRLHKHMIRNYYRLNTPLSAVELSGVCTDIQNENRSYIRFNSLGELSGINNLLNYYRICEKLPGFHFGLWTKRPAIIRKTDKKPDNLSIIYSNPVLDQPVTEIPAGFNGVFNVVTYEYCDENNIIPNCTGQCITCLKCYTGKPVIVTELLKKDQNSIRKGFLKPLEV